MKGENRSYPILEEIEMKKFAALLMLLSLSVFSLGCEQPADDGVDTAPPPAGDEDTMGDDGAAGEPGGTDEGEVEGAG